MVGSKAYGGVVHENESLISEPKRGKGMPLNTFKWRKDTAQGRIVEF